MKAILLILSAMISTAAFAEGNVVETGSWAARCLIFTTGPSGDDVKILANVKPTLELGQNVPITVLYTEGKLEFKAWLTHFVTEDGRIVANHMDVGIFKRGKYIGGARTEFTDQIPSSLQYNTRNITSTKGPPALAISCRRE